MGNIYSTYSARISLDGLRVSSMLEMRVLVNTLGWSSRYTWLVAR